MQKIPWFCKFNVLFIWMKTTAKYISTKSIVFFVCKPLKSLSLSLSLSLSIYIYIHIICIYIHIYLNIYSYMYIVYCIYIYILYIYIYIYIVFTTEGFLEVAIEVGLSGIWTQDHWIPFRCSNQLSSQMMSSTRSQIQLCTATPILSHCSVFTFHFGLCLRQSQHLLLAKFCTSNNVSSRMTWYIWYLPVKDF